MGMDEWWREAAIYQIYPRSFQDSDGDGIGDLAGIGERLTYLSWLGIDAIWLSPIFTSPMEDGGYDVSNYRDIDPVFGTLPQFDELLERAHSMGIRVILDFVPNHTSWRHPWFQQSASDRDNPKRDWYLWADGRESGKPPNNWRSVGQPGSAWTWHPETGQYYLSSFSPAQPELNWGNPIVRAEMYNVLRFWLDRGVDGFRIDMVDFLAKDQLLRDEPSQVFEARDPFAVARYHLNQPETLEYIAEMRQVADAYGDSVLIGEVTHYPSVELLSRYYLGGSGLHLPANFRLLFIEPDATTIRAFVRDYEAALPANAQPNYCIGSHDVLRPSKYGPGIQRLLTLLLLTLRGTPILYYGDEIGMRNVRIPREKQVDRWIAAPMTQGRDPARTPMQWDPTENAGFTAADVEPWLPLDPEYRRRNVEALKADPDSLLQLIRQLLALRKAEPALRQGTYQAIETAESAVYGYCRRLAGRDLLVFLNFADHQSSIEEKMALYGTVLLSTHSSRIRHSSALSGLLEPYEGVVIASEA